MSFPFGTILLRLAEEIAMLDILSHGRIISGFVRGTGVESVSSFNTNPAYNRERFEEAHDLIVKTWTTPGPFRWEGKPCQFTVSSIPGLCHIQKPHPPIWVPGTASPETAAVGRQAWLYVRGVSHPAQYD